MNFYDVIFAQQKTKADSKYFGEISDAINVLNGSEGTYLPSEMGAAIIDAIPTEEVTDNIVSVTDAAAYPAEGLEFAIEPVQDLHGYDRPWPAGGGKNLANVSDYSQGFTNALYIDKAIGITLEAGVTYTFSCDANSTVTPFIISVGVGSGGLYRKDIVTKGDQDNGRVYITFTPTAEQLTNHAELYVRLPRFTTPQTGTVSVSKIQLELGSTATSYEPYANICPISGWTGVQGKHSGADTTQYTEIPITFPTEAGTVYGGKVDVVNGKLLAYPEYDSYNGETLTGKWISSMDAYVAGTTPTIGAQVVDLSGAGTEYDITPQQVKMLLGDNNVWCDTGDTTLKYKVDLGRYIDKIKSQQSASTLSVSPLSLGKSAVLTSTDGADADEIEEADESVLHDEVKVSEEAEELTLKKEITEELAETEKVEDIKETEEQESKVEE